MDYMYANLFFFNRRRLPNPLKFTSSLSFA